MKHVNCGKAKGRNLLRENNEKKRTKGKKKKKEKKKKKITHFAGSESSSL